MVVPIGTTVRVLTPLLHLSLLDDSDPARQTDPVEALVLVTVVDVNEPPVITVSETVVISETAVAGSVLGEWERERHTLSWREHTGTWHTHSRTTITITTTTTT